MPPFAGPSVTLYWTRYPVNTSISPLSIWMGQETVIWRLGWVRIFQMPGSRLRMRAAPSNSWSIALKIDPCVAAITLPVETGQRTVPRGGESSRAAVSDWYNVPCMKTAAETGKARWAHETLEPALKKSPERAASFTTISGRPIERLYTAEDVEGIDYARDVNNPGAFPYTRGIHPTGYRGKLWTMRQFAGFGTPEDTNARYKTLLGAGGTGLRHAFDLPTLTGLHPPH